MASMPVLRAGLVEELPMIAQFEIGVIGVT